MQQLEANQSSITVLTVSDILILKFLDQYFKASETLGTWYLDQLKNNLTHDQIENYILNSYLPTLNYTPEQIEFCKNGYGQYQFEYAEALRAKLQPNQMVEQSQISPETVQVQTVEDSIVDTVEDTTKFDAALIVPDTNLEEMRRLQTVVDESLNKIMLLKEECKQGEYYVNDSYLHCPSFNKLIPQVQAAIISKRKLKANEKWFEKYRPELVEEVLFPNQVIKETITQFVENKHIAGNCMFYGEGGVGKTTTNIILMNGILENVADRFFLDRKIESVDELKGWLNKKPIGKQKIVIAEEFDRLSDAAMTELKNGLMEKYEYVVFLASTNKIHKIDEALLTRFTVISKFETAQESDLYNKCRYILSNERIKYTEEGLKFFIDNNKLKGIRTILNNLQLSCYQGVFEPKRTSFYIGNSGTEYDMIQWIKYYIGYLMQCPKQVLLYLTYSLDNDQNVKQVRDNLLQTLMANYSLNYDYIFTELLKDNIFLPIKNCVNTYYQDIDSKRIKAMHFEAMLNEFILIAFNTKDIYAGQ